MTENTIMSIILGIIGVLCTIIGALLLLGISKTLGELKAIWLEIKEIQNKQGELRTTLPEEYLKVDGLGFKAILDSLSRIERHSEQVALELAETKRYVRKQ